MKKKIKLSLIEIIIIVTIPTVILSFLTGTVLYSKLNNKGKVTSTNNEYVNQFINVYNELLDEYYEDLDENELVDAAINGMLSYAGDDYTIYMNEDATESLNSQLNGTYEGIGIKITLDENFNMVIVEVFNDSPASISGLKVNDIIKAVNDISVENKSTTEASDIIKNSKEPNVKIKVLRDNKELDFTVERKTLIVPAITSSIKEVNGKKIGYIYLSTFNSTVDTQISTTLSSMEKDGIDSLILDVRSNTGGYLTNCTKIIEMFLKKGTLMYSIKSKDNENHYYDETEEERNYPIVILINGGSASASEILATALRDSYGATIIGTKSYGKGKVQTTGTLSDGTMIKYTSALWYTPKGECIDEVGILPNIEINLSDKYIDNPIDENDDQLNEAIKILTK